jgi:hypothetical protein
MPRYAFKEWAVVCRALATGEQSLLLRKGGIAEESGVFRPDHARFWLFPTFLHQNVDGLKSTAAAELAYVERDRPPSDVVRLTHFAEAPVALRITRLESVLELDRLHVWSETTVRQRFAYREPGLYVLPIRVFAAATAIELPNRAEYDGCKTWVDLGVNIPGTGTPVITDRAFAEVVDAVERAIPGEHRPR